MVQKWMPFASLWRAGVSKRCRLGNDLVKSCRAESATGALLQFPHAQGGKEEIAGLGQCAPCRASLLPAGRCFSSCLAVWLTCSPALGSRGKNCSYLGETADG